MASCLLSTGLEEERDVAHLGWGLSKGDAADPGAEGTPLALERGKCRPLCKAFFEGGTCAGSEGEEDTGIERKQRWVCACVTLLQF